MRLIDAEPLEEILLLRRVQCSNDYGSIAGAINGCLKLVQLQPSLAPPPNDPLTMKELREMDGEPVWVESCRNAKRGKYVVLGEYCQELHCLGVSGGGLLDCTVMGKGWLAYRRRPGESKKS